jgi:hypothetical protein
MCAALAWATLVEEVSPRYAASVNGRLADD